MDKTNIAFFQVDINVIFDEKWPKRMADTIPINNLSAPVYLTGIRSATCGKCGNLLSLFL